MKPRCPICGEVFEADEHDKATKLRDVHMDWCWDVETTAKRLSLGLPAPLGVTAHQIEAARERLPDDSQPIQTRIDGW